MEPDLHYLFYYKHLLATFLPCGDLGGSYEELEVNTLKC